jgi:high-affinity iron transporter
MFEALIVTLREGVEAALVVGIIAAFLRRQGAARYLGAVWSGILVAIAASLLLGVALRRLTLNEEVLEGTLYLAAALVVGSAMIWMWRHGKALSGEMKGSLARILNRERGGSIAAGIFLFTFVTVFREGVETVLFLSALSLTSSGLQTLLGVLAGLAAAFTFGVLFVRGSVRIDLGRFFKVTGIALAIFIVQLLVNGYHELAEAGWMPANQASMALIGPLVKNELFFILAVLALPLLMLLVPGREATPAAAPAASAAVGAAAARLERATAARQAGARIWGGALGAVILAALSLGFVYSRPPAALSAATAVTVDAGGAVRIPVAGFQGTALRRFVVDVPTGGGGGARGGAGGERGGAGDVGANGPNGANAANAAVGVAGGVGAVAVRFIAVPLDDPRRPGAAIAVAFDACEICGARGYYQEGGNVTCLHCGSAIYPPSIGQHGGCNPVPLPSRREGGDLVIQAADLAKGAPLFSAAAMAHHPGM